MAGIETEGWHNAYLRARQIESEVSLPAGSIKPETPGLYSLVFVHLSEEQIRQMAHLWFVLSQTSHLNQGHPDPPAHHR